MEDTSVMEQSEQTTGDFATEAEAAAAFDALIDPADWHLEREVRGTLLHPRPFVQPDGALKIDRVLIPTRALIKRGWRHGYVGIEIKRSGAKIGPLLAQALDYQRCAWRGPNGGLIVCEYIFVWHVRNVANSIASVMAQSKIGCASAFRNSNQIEELRLMYNNNPMYLGGKVMQAVVGGRKVGSR